MKSGLRLKKSALSLSVAALLLAQVAVVDSALADTAAAGVGEVSLVLGKAYLEAADNSRELIRAGTRISVSDRVVTEANGHVHIRFDDDALVSVRPDSLLEIERYDYNAASPEQSSIKLNLVEGVTRAISGKGAHAARERFRLNTPIAAIGVRGTDFVVSATDVSVRALVSEGAIVVAPFSSDCLASNFGPCVVNAVELTQESLQVVQMDGRTPLPRLVPAADERGPLSREEVEVEVADAPGKAEDKAVGTDVYLESVTSRKVALVASNAVLPPVTPPAPLPPAILPPVTTASDFTPGTALVAADVASDQLVWGRYTDLDGQGVGERLSTTYELASVGREIAVGDNVYGLFRTENGTKRIAPDLGVVSFGLSSAQAFYHSGSGVVAMQVNSGNLKIDFNESSFATNLGLSHSSTGKVDFSAAGRIDDGSYGGYFYSNTDTQKMHGAVSLDGAEAGYFFEKQLLDGSVQGLTLWNKQ
ncbi:MAG: FecR family protein [Gammaproteobacteria bacterium]|nr:FecR family protein [Gammaproteobacteria bacterium]